MPLTAKVFSMARAISSRDMGMVRRMALAEFQRRSRWASTRRLAGVAADALEHAVAVEQAVVVDADLGVFFA